MGFFLITLIGFVVCYAIAVCLDKYGQYVMSKELRKNEDIETSKEINKK